jgi:hypothetical protein
MQMSEHSQVRCPALRGRIRITHNTQENAGLRLTRRVILLPLLLAAFSLAGCAGNPFSPESGMALPTDPGTIAVRVRTPAGVPVSGVSVLVTDIPNKVGSFYSRGQRTDSSGIAVFAGIDAGIRRVTLPDLMRFPNDPDWSREVTVIEDASVTVEFRIPAK